MTQIELFRQQTMDYYRERPAEFIEDFVYIECVGKDPLVQKFKLWSAQKEAVKSILKNRLNAILKARQIGITWLTLSMCVWAMLVFKGFRIGAISKSEDDAKELVRRMTVILSNMPTLIQAEREAPAGWSGATYSSTAMDITVMTRNGPDSVFKAFPASTSAGRSFTFNWLVLDEWAFHQFADEIWTSLFPTVNSGAAKVIGLSTIKRGSLFENIFVTADNGFNKIFIPWTADPARDEKWYHDTVGALGPEKTLQEYPATIEEALMVPGGQMFPEVKRETHLKKHDAFWDNPVRRYVAIDYGLDMFSCHWIAIDSDGHARAYREYDAPNKTIGEAAAIYRDLTGNEQINLILAPPDLWNRDQVHGKSRALIFQEHGMSLTKVSNDFPAGVSCMKEWLALDEKGTGYLTFEECPVLFKCLQKILIDPNRPDVYAKKPHDLTHDCDSLRYFCVYYTRAADKKENGKRKKWTDDMREDWDNATPEIRALMEKRFGRPA